MRRIEIEPRILRKVLAETYLGSPLLLEQLVKTGEVRPLPNSGKLQLFDRKDLDAAIDRVKIHGMKG
jgi:hypothetical protein